MADGEPLLHNVFRAPADQSQGTDPVLALIDHMAPGDTDDPLLLYVQALALERRGHPDTAL